MSSFIKNVGIMSISPLITQILTFFIMPVVTRIYSPDDFGLFAIYCALLGPISILSTMGYSTAIVIPKKDAEASTLFSLGIFFTFAVSVLSALLILVISSPLLNWINQAKLDKIIWLIPISIISHGLYMSLRFWNIRKERFKYITGANISRFLTNNTSLLIFGFTGFVSGVYIILADFIASIASPAVLSKNIWKENKELIIKNCSIQKMKEVAKRYSKFPKYIMSNDILDQFLIQIPIYILSFYFSQASIGFYALGMRLLVMPINLIGNSIGEVFFQRISKDNTNSAHFIENIFKYLVLFAIPVFSFLGLLGEDIFSLFFGKDWSEAGVFSQILCLLIFTKFITIPANYIMLIHEKQEYSILLNLCTLTVSSVSLIIGGIFNDIYLSFTLYSVSNSIVYAVYGFGFMKYSGLALNKMFNLLSQAFFKCLPLVLALIFVKTYVNNNLIMLVIVSIFLLCLFYILLALLTPEINFLYKSLYLKLKNKFFNQ